MPEIRVVLPVHLRVLAATAAEISVPVPAPVTPRAIVDAIVARYPMLGGTLCEYATGERRPLVRFFACEEDVSHAPLDAPLPDAIAAGTEPFLIVGAMAGG
jgi:hypothetical protein